MESLCRGVIGHVYKDIVEMIFKDIVFGDMLFLQY